MLEAARAARDIGLDVWAITGRAPNPLLDVADDAVAVDAATTATVQEVHQLAVHLLCEALEHALFDATAHIGMVHRV